MTRNLQRWLRPLASILALASGLALAGCNLGTAGILAVVLLSQDGGGGGGGKGGSTVLSTAEFAGVDNARARPAEAVIRLRLFNDANVSSRLVFEFSDLDAGGDFRPLSIVAPFPGDLTSQGVLGGVPGSETGRLHRIGWNALADLGTDDLHHVRVRVTGDLAREEVVDVLVGNDAPLIAAVDLDQEAGGPVGVALRVVDSSSDPVDIVMEFAPPPAPPADPDFGDATTEGETESLPSSPDGVQSAFAWAAVSDLGPFDRPAIVRFTPIDRVDGTQGKTGTSVMRDVSLDSNRPPESEVLGDELAADADARRGIAIPVVLADLEGNPVDAVIQWTPDGGAFPDLPASLDEDAAAREALLLDAGERRRLQIVTLRAQRLEGTVEAPADPAALDATEVLATWVKSAEELRGLAAGGALAGRQVELVPAGGGASQLRRACGYDPERGVLVVDAAFAPPAAPGSRLRLDLGGERGALRLPASAGGTAHRFVWDSGSDAAGGGSFRFRLTPYDLVASEAVDPCGAVATRPDPSVALGDRGPASISAGAKRVRGPYRDEDPLVIDLPPVDAPSAIDERDMDGDGTVDLVYAARESNAVVILRQTAPGVFDPLRLLDDGLASPAALIAADLDGDGDGDVAVAGEESENLLLIFQEPGLDFFTQRAPLTAGGRLRRPTALAARDLDGNGSVDLAVAMADPSSPGAAIFYRQNPRGYSFVRLPPLPGGNDPLALAAADIDGDGRPDLALAGRGFLAMYTQSGAGDFGSAPTRVEVAGADLRAVAVFDFDLDGELDVVAADRAEPGLVILRQRPNDTFLPPLRVAVEGLRGPVGMASADLDGAGPLDLAIADAGDPAAPAGGSVAVLLGAAAGYSADTLVRLPPLGAAAPAPVAVLAADIDGDGAPEIVSADEGARQIAIFTRGGPGAFRGEGEALAGEALPPAPASLRAADIDGDARIDLLAANPATADLTLLHQGPGAAFLARRVAISPLDAPAGTADAAAGDVNGDGRADIAVANRDSDNLSLLFQDEEGNFVRLLPASLRANGFTGPQSVALADLDGDGRLDVVAGARFSDDARWFRQAADGSFSEGGIFRPATGSGVLMMGPVIAAAGDLNGDGRTDVAAAAERSGNVLLFLQQGAGPVGTFAPAVAIALGAGLAPVALALGDLEGDGDIDVAAATLGTSHLVVARRTPTGDYQVTRLAAVEGASPTAVALRDLDGDGKLDAIVALSGSGGLAGEGSSRLRILFQEAAADLSDARVLDLASPFLHVPVAAAAADLDGDGEADVAAADRASPGFTAFFGGR